jgi:hypothetical protein
MGVAVVDILRKMSATPGNPPGKIEYGVLKHRYGAPNICSGIPSKDQLSTCTFDQCNGRPKSIWKRAPVGSTGPGSLVSGRS